MYLPNYFINSKCTTVMVRIIVNCFARREGSLCAHKDPVDDVY